MSNIFPVNDDNIKTAADTLARGGLVAIPTETVYGLGADATQDKAVARIFEAKGRPQFNPLIIHVLNVRDAEKYVEFNDVAHALATIFWPGPLTFILPRKKGANVSLLTSAGLPTQAVRAPQHPVARALIERLGRPIAAPSANASGSLSPTTPQHVFDSLGEHVDMILAGGKTGVGLESTVVDLTGDIPILLRHGGIPFEDLKMHISNIELFSDHLEHAPKSPGQLLKHYAPKTPLRLKAVDVEEGEALLGFGSIKFMGIKGGGGSVQKLSTDQRLNLSESGDLNEAASNLFAMLHQLDKGGYNGIAVMDIPNMGLGMAINDRLNRAAIAQRAD